MLGWTITFLVIALVSAALGFTELTGLVAEIGRCLFCIFLVFFIISVAAGAIWREAGR